MSTWLDKPDADGLWWYQVSRGMFLIAVRGGEARDVIDSTGTPNVHGPHAHMQYFESGKWQRCELTRPEPYKPPVPPKVEQCTGVMKTGGERRFLTFVGHSCIVSTFDAVTFGAFSSDWVRANYTDIKPLESPP